jgi:phage shock protein PspC (stress-responsive transcriptional regulator)
MNKVITINLNGNAYPLEEGGYEALREYLDNASRRLEGNPDREEIIADIEQAIADKFRAALGPYKTVVATRDVQNVIAEMGPVQDDSAPDGPSAETAGPRSPEGADEEDRPSGTGAASSTPAAPKRLYIINDGAMLGGVCNGIAAYLNIDVTIVRLFFVLMVISFGVGVLLYLLLMILLPTAQTPAEKAAAHGAPFTAEEFIRRAKAGYYEGMKTFNDPQSHRQWKRKFKQEMRSWKKDFKWQILAAQNAARCLLFLRCRRQPDRSFFPPLDPLECLPLGGSPVRRSLADQSLLSARAPGLGEFAAGRAPDGRFRPAMVVAALALRRRRARSRSRRGPCCRRSGPPWR